MRLVSLEHRGFEPLAKEGAHKVRVKYLIDRPDGAKNFFLRYYVVEKGGHTPLDRHPYEHEVYILQGRGLVREGEGEALRVRGVRPGDAVFIASNELHQFVNMADEPLAFLCVKGAEELY